MTSDEQFQMVLRKEDEKQSKKKKQGKKKEAANAFEVEDDDIGERVQADSDEENYIEESDHFIDEEIRELFPPVMERQGYLYLRKVWDEINPPVKE